MRLFTLPTWLAIATPWTNSIWHTGSRHTQSIEHIPIDTSESNNSSGHGTFSQLIDHSNPDLGTFEQFFAYHTKYYAGPGSPVVLFTPGELNASLYYDYLTTQRLTGVLAERIHAAIILLEHRYFGTSSPFTELTTANMTYLTLENSIYDLTNFAANVELPFDRTGGTNAPSAPWVMMGASYSGALAAWTQSVAPGTLWAYQASSAPVEALWNFWSYYLPVEEGMAKNCSKDVKMVVEHMDNVLTTGSDQEIHDLKSMFGLESIEHNNDFMEALSWPAGLWQDNQFYSASADFYTWCDYVENSHGEKNFSKLPDAEGVGLQRALQGYAAWAKAHLPTFCKELYSYNGYGYFPKGSFACFDTYNASSPIFTDTSLANTAYRAWIWMLCDWPVGWFEGGPPEGRRPTIVSRLINPDYWIRQCSLYFPLGHNIETFGIQKGRTAAFVNSYTCGWNARNSTHLQYTNGQFDPVREASVSADLRPGGPLQSSPHTPVLVVPGGFHGSDMVTENGAVNADCKSVQEQEIKQLAEWVDEFSD